MKGIKKWIIRLLILLAVVIITGLVYIEMNKKELVALAVEEMNASIEGTLSYQEADISLFSSFPDLAVSLHNVVLHDVTRQEAKALLDVEMISIDVNLISAFKKNLIVNTVTIKEGIVYMAVYKDGTTNYNISKSSNEETSQQVDFEISQYNISNIDLIYVDYQEGNKTKLEKLNATGRLSYKSKYIYLINDFSSDLVIDYGSMLPSYQVRLGGTIENTISPSFDTIAINRSELLVNDLPIRIKGQVILADEMAYHLDFGSPSTEIKRLMSLFPAYYKNQYKDLVSSGTFVLNGTINGNASDQFPLYKVSLLTSDGQVYYPSLETRIDKLSFSLLAENEKSTSFYTKLVINDLDIKTGKSNLIGNLTSYPSELSHSFDMDVVVDVDLSDVRKSMILDHSTILDGYMKGILIGGGKYDPSERKSFVSDERLDIDLILSDIKFKGAQTQLSIANSIIQSDIRKLDIQANDVSYNDALDFDMDGYINTPLMVVLNANAEITGRMKIDAGRFDINQLIAIDSDSIEMTSDFKIPNANIDFKFTANELTQGTYVFNNITTSGNLSDGTSNVYFLIEDMNGSRFEGDAKLDSLISYGLNGETLTGTVKVESDQLDLNQFIQINTEDDSKPYTKEGPLIPNNIDLDIDYQSEQIVFKNIDIVKSLGTISIKDKQLIFKNEGDIFGGKVLLTGIFDTDRPDGYHISLSLDLKQLGFAQTAAKMKIFNQLLPIAKFLEGEYTAALSWSSDLDKDFVPDLNSLTAKGVIRTRNGRINGLLPIDSFLQRFNVIKEVVEPIKISDANKFFIVEDGRVLVKDIEFKKGDIVVRMDGTHSFSQQLNYNLSIEVPKRLMDVGNVISVVQDKVKFASRIKNAGENLTVEVEAIMGGQISKPTFGVKGINLKSGDVVESIGDVIVATVENTRDSIETVVKDTINNLKDEIVTKVDSVLGGISDVIDSSKQVVTDLIDSTKVVVKDEIEDKKNEIENVGTDILGDILSGKTDSIKIKVDDVFNNNKSALDSLAKKLPFPIFKGNN